MKYPAVKANMCTLVRWDNSEEVTHSTQSSSVTGRTALLCMFGRLDTKWSERLS